MRPSLLALVLIGSGRAKLVRDEKVAEGMRRIEARTVGVVGPRGGRRR
ncbi:hypothetical protein ACF08O_32170 [Streptomyces paradoxus]